jgi:hypothetical protein
MPHHMSSSAMAKVIPLAPNAVTPRRSAHAANSTPSVMQTRRSSKLLRSVVAALDLRRSAWRNSLRNHTTIVITKSTFATGLAT